VLLFVMNEKISFVVCLRQRQRQQILAPTKKSEKKQNWWPNVFTKKFTLSFAKAPSNVSLSF